METSNCAAKAPSFPMETSSCVVATPRSVHLR